MKKTMRVVIGTVAVVLVGVTAWGLTVTDPSSHATPALVSEINTALDQVETAVDALESGGTPGGNSTITGSVTFVQGGVTTRWDNAASKIDAAAIENGTLPSGITVASANVTDGEIALADMNSANGLNKTNTYVVASDTNIPPTLITNVVTIVKGLITAWKTNGVAIP